MATAKIEHLNNTVIDPQRSAEVLSGIFGWVVRWKGQSKLGGETIHVGERENGQTYLALYNYDSKSVSVLNHVDVIVDDHDGIEFEVVSYN